MADVQHYLVAFENVSASVGGTDISSIVEFQLNAVANGIPSITLLVDAGHPSAGATVQVAESMKLSNARKLLDQCRGMVKKSSSSLQLSITARAYGGSGDAQTLSISGWMLTDVSLSPIQESGVCTVALTFQHPICKSHFGGAIPGLLAKPIRFEGLSGGNPLAVFLNALELYGQEAEREEPRPASIEGASDSEKVRSELLKRLAQAKSDLSSSVKWSGGGLPAGTELSEWSDLEQMGIAVYAMPSGGTSVFQRFAKALVPECSLAMGGDFTSSTLDVGPFKPWADSTMTIDDSDIISLQFPQSDPSPLSGVKITANDTSDVIPFSFHVDTSQIEVKPADIYYVPESEFSAEYLYGPIQQFQEPGWLSAMKAFELSRSNSGGADVSSDNGGNMNTATSVGRDETVTFSGSADDSSSIDYSDAMLACAKAYYETSLMKDWAFTVNTRLMFTSGGIICPGKVIAVQSDGSKILEGYVTSVTHTISVSNRTATTSIRCTHPRFGQKPDSITSGNNALYAG